MPRRQRQLLGATSALAALIALAALVASACGSLDIDALGAGGGDAADDPRDAAGIDAPAPGAEGGSGVDGASASDAGWHAPRVDDAPPWTATGWRETSAGTTSDLEAVWGATSRSVWAGGTQGALVHFDGTDWSTRTSTVAANGIVRAIAGTAEDDVYLLEHRGAPDGTMVLHHHDGIGWAEVGTFPGVGAVGCLDVPARRVAYVYGALSSTSTRSGDDVLRLYRVDGRAASGITSLGATSSPSMGGRCGVHAFAPDDVWLSGDPLMRWDGNAFAPLGGSPPSSDMLSVVSRTLAFTRAEVWNGTAWRPRFTGVPGALNRVSGVGDALAFGVVYSVEARILRYQGDAWIGADRGGPRGHEGRVDGAERPHLRGGPCRRRVVGPVSARALDGPRHAQNE